MEDVNGVGGAYSADTAAEGCDGLRAFIVSSLASHVGDWSR